MTQGSFENIQPNVTKFGRKKMLFSLFTFILPFVYSQGVQYDTVLQSEIIGQKYNLSIEAIINKLLIQGIQLLSLVWCKSRSMEHLVRIRFTCNGLFALLVTHDTTQDTQIAHTTCIY